MCLNSKLIKNRKYIPNKKNGGHPPVLVDIRTKYVPIGCGVCFECRKQKANGWKTRLYEEIKGETDWSFITLTFNNESLESLRNELYKECVNMETGELFDENVDLEKATGDNAVCTLAMRRFLERWRKLNKKSVKHFFISEKGHNGTKRIHLHGIIKSRDKSMITEKWGYGWIYYGDYVNEKTINYISKYITKVDLVNIGFEGKILCSPGIGSKFMKSANFKLYKFKGDKTLETYITNKGLKTSLPIYYRNYCFNADEREKLWIQRLDKKERFVLGERVDISSLSGLKSYEKLLHSARILNIQMGYKNDKNWDKNKYLKLMKKLNI